MSVVHVLYAEELCTIICVSDNQSNCKNCLTRQFKDPPYIAPKIGNWLSECPYHFDMADDIYKIVNHERPGTES